MACGDCIAHQIGSTALLEDLANRSGPDSDFPLAGSLELTLACKKNTLGVPLPKLSE